MAKFLMLVNGIKTSKLVDELDLPNLQTTAPLVEPGGRLTLVAGDPVGGLTSGVASASTLRYLPYSSNLVPVWDTALQQWRYLQLSAAGATLAVNNSSSGNHDVFLTAAGALGLSAWSNDLNRGASLIRVGGCLMVGSSAADARLYLGTIRLLGNVGSLFCMDNSGARFVWNAYNRVPKFLRQLEVAASWTFNSSTARPWNNSTNNRIQVVCGDAASADLSFVGRIEAAAGTGGLLALALDSITTAVDYVYAVNWNGDLNLRWCGPVAAGYHYFQALEAAFGGTVTFRGDTVYGLKGMWLC
jgi:hypothetical protein